MSSDIPERPGALDRPGTSAGSRMRIAVAVNPAASFGSKTHIGPAVVGALTADGHEVRVLQRESAALLSADVINAIDGGLDALVVVGGDGIVSLAVNAIGDSGVPLGIVPGGTGNDLARGLGIPLSDTDAAIRVLRDALRRPPRAIDVACVQQSGTTTRFAGVLSAGFDALVNERANSWRWPRGESRYTLAILRELIGLRSRTYRITSDGRETLTQGILVSVANNTSIGGGMLIAPDADLADGLFDVVVVQPVSRFRLLRLFPKVFSGTHTSLDVVSITRARSVRLESDGVVAYADGERIGALPVDLEMLPGGLNVLAPRVK